MPKTSSLRSLLRNRRGYRLLQQKLSSIARALVPAAIALSFATVAHAQGTMDFSGAQTLMGTFKTFPLPAPSPLTACGALMTRTAFIETNLESIHPFSALGGTRIAYTPAGAII